MIVRGLTLPFILLGHYNQAGGHPGQAGMAPYPRFPPYDRMGYYNQNLDVYSRPDSPSSQVGVPVGAAANNNNNSSSNNNNTNGMLQQQNGTTALSGGHPQPHPQQQPIVYASCKLQAAVGAGGGGGMMVSGDSLFPSWHFYLTFRLFVCRR